MNPRPSRSTSIKAPIGGWNTRDSYADMDVSYAPILTNWWPSATDLMMRRGFSNYATGLINQVESLMVYSGGGSDKMFAASGSSFYEVTNPGAVGAAVVTGLSNARWQTQNIATVGGNFMLCVNGLDKLRGYSGTSWWVDGDGTHDITGFDTSTASSILLFKNRIWMAQKNSLNVWYLGTDSIAGAASYFPLQAIARKGGYIVSMDAWTIDAGYGVDDLISFITNKGEVILYRGTDPSSASTWSLVGVWEIGAPVGNRPMFKFSGDLLILGQDGLTPMSAALQSSRVNPAVALTNIIQPTISASIAQYYSNYGWQTVYFPQANMLLINVPVSTGSQEQYVMNTITKAWARFTGWAANCFVVYKDKLYFGANGVVCQAWNTFADNMTNIKSEAAQAFSYFGNPGVLKRWTMMRPILSTSGSPAIRADLNIDYQMTTSYAPLSVVTTTYGAWDSAIWDSAIWADSLSISKYWQGITGVGYSAGAELECASNGIETHWVSTDFVFEIGDVL